MTAQISRRAQAALEELPSVTLCFRYETGMCMGVFLVLADKLHVLPVNHRQRLLLSVLNSELRRENPEIQFEEQVEFDDEWQPPLHCGDTDAGLYLCRDCTVIDGTGCGKVIED